MKQIIKSVLLRFVRAFLAGAAATMVVVVPMSGGWKELQSWLGALALAGIVGGISGVIQAMDKYYRSVE